MQDVKGIVGELQVLVVVDRRHGGLALADVVVVVDVVGQTTLFFQIRHCLLHQLIEDVVGALHVLSMSNSANVSAKVLKSMNTVEQKVFLHAVGPRYMRHIGIKT